MRLFYPSNTLSPTFEVKLLQKEFKNKKFKDRIIIKALFGKKVQKNFKNMHFRKIGVYR